jgi:hypothetical protein
MIHLKRFGIGLAVLVGGLGVGYLLGEAIDSVLGIGLVNIFFYSLWILCAAALSYILGCVVLWLK